MGVTDYIARQFAHPHGAVAPVMGMLLNDVNKKVNQSAVDAVELRSGGCVVDVGFGGGVGVRMALAEVGGGGRVIAVDPSEELVARAASRFSDDIEAGRLAVHVGEVAQLPVDTSSVDAAYTVNTVYFWPDVTAGLGELRRVVRAQGRCVIAVQPSVMARHERFSGLQLASPQELVAMAERVGFNQARVVEPRKDVLLVVADA